MEHVGEPLHHVAVAGVLEESGEGESEFHGVVSTPLSGSARISSMYRAVYHGRPGADSLCGVTP